jgi:hypothetical protein
MRNRIWPILALSALAFAPLARAASDFDPTSLASLTTKLAEDLVTQVAISADHRAFEPASPLGLAIGLDVGLDFVASRMTADFRQALTVAGVQGSLPDYVLLPRLNIHKGLPWGVDLGFSYIGYQGNSITGYEAKWAFLRGAAVKPSVAVRVSHTASTLFFMKTNTTKIDAVVSKTVGWFLEPYLGAGLQIISGSIETPAGVPDLPADVPRSHSTASPHVYAGLPLKLVFLHLTAEYDYSFTGIQTFGTKISLDF